MKKGRQDRIAKTLTPACSSLLFFKEKNGISRAEPFPKKREKTMRNEMNIKNMFCVVILGLKNVNLNNLSL